MKTVKDVRQALFWGGATKHHIEILYPSSSPHFRTEAALTNGYSFGSDTLPVSSILDKWNSYAIVWDNAASPRTVKWYMNGSLFYTDSNFDDSDNGTNEYFSFTGLGRATGSGTYLYAQSFMGYVPLFISYNKKLTDAQILQNHNSIKDRFDDVIVKKDIVLYVDPNNINSYPGSGTTLYDMSGNDLNGTMSNEAMGTASSGSLRLDGVNDKIYWAHNSLLEPANLTIMAWVNLTDISDRHILITKWYGWSFEISSGGYPYLRIYGSSVSDLTSNTAISWDNWHHIASTFDDDNNVRYIYVDGVQTGTVSDTGSISYNQNYFSIPYSNNPVNAKGKIGEVEIYSRALSYNEIRQNYYITRKNYV